MEPYSVLISRFFSSNSSYLLFILTVNRANALQVSVLQIISCFKSKCNYLF